jgi:hypothetical protein
MQFRLEFGKSVADAPSGFESSVETAANTLASMFSSNETITVHVGWGVINGHPFIAPGVLSESLNMGKSVSVSYDKFRAALENEAGNSSVQAEAAASLPSENPLPGNARVHVFNAEAQALGLAKNRGLDGAIGVGDEFSYFFSESNPIQGYYDAVGVEMHELSEVMGRVSLLGIRRDQPQHYDGHYAPLDFFRYSAPGQEELADLGGYFSIDGGNTNLGTYNWPALWADPGDFALTTTDSFGSRDPGVPSPLSGVDVAEMAAIGFNLSPTGLAMVQNLTSVDPKPLG